MDCACVASTSGRPDSDDEEREAGTHSAPLRSRTLSEKDGPKNHVVTCIYTSLATVKRVGVLFTHKATSR